MLSTLTQIIFTPLGACPKNLTTPHRKLFPRGEQGDIDFYSQNLKHCWYVVGKPEVSARH